MFFAVDFFLCVCVCVENCLHCCLVEIYFASRYSDDVHQPTDLNGNTVVYQNPEYSLSLSLALFYFVCITAHNKF